MSERQHILSLMLSLLLITSIFIGFVTLSGTAAAAGNALPISEEFDTPNPSDWNFYDQASSGNTVDGSQSLRLTQANNDEKGTALYSNAFDSSNGITAEFRYYSDDGSATGADGISFFLLDSSQVDPDTFTPGPSGGALGYDRSSDGKAGIEGGYLGVGFDEFGNFDGGDSDRQDVVIRGQGDASTDDSDYPIVKEADPSQNVDGGWRRARITVDPTEGTSNEIGLRVEMSWDGGSSWETQIDSTVTESEISPTGDSIPDNFYLGFSGSTGGSTNTHAIDSVDITKPADISTSVTSGANGDPYHAGETVAYTFDVTNSGPNDDSNIELSTSGLTTGASGLKNLEWDTNNDDSFNDDTGSSTTISLNNGNTQTVQLRGTVGDDATGNLDHDITASTSGDFNDPNPSDNDDSLSVTLNTAPSFTSDESLPNINEDPSSNGGAQIDSNELFGDEFSDGDGDSFAGVVATDDAADSSAEGSWQYSTDDGSTWHDIDDGSLSASNGLLLDSTTKIRFDPVVDYNGNPGKLTIHAVDDSGSNSFTAGATRETYDTDSDGKSSVAAESSNTLDITVDPVNDAPTISSFSVTNPNNRDVDVTFESDEQLSTIEASLSGEESATLLRNDFSETNNGGSYEYFTTYVGSSDGTYTVTLEIAEDSNGLDGSNSQSGSVDISTSGGGGGITYVDTNDDSDDDDEESTEETGGSDDDGDDGQYSSAPEGSTVVTGEKTDSDDTSETSNTVSFGVSVSGDEGDSDSNTVVLDIVGSNRNDEETTETATDTDTETDDDTATDTGTDTLEDGDTPEESTTPEDDDTPADSDTTDEDSDQSSAGGEKNVAVDSMVIETTDDAASEFSITVREWSVNTTATPGADAGNPQNSLAVADAADNIDPSANTLASGSNTDSMTAGQTSDRTDPRQFLEETSASAVGYVEVNHTNPDSEIENVTFQFRVRKSYLNGSAVGPDSVALYRDETAGWNELDAEQVSENETFYFFEATSPGLSLFTIGSTQPVIETHRVETSTTTIAEGESTTVEATVTNLGPVDGNHTVSLTADGEQVASQSVAVAGNETESVTLTFTPDTAGEYDLAIDGQDAGVLSVQAPTGESTESDDSAGGSVLVGLLIVVVVAGLLVVYVRRHDDAGDSN